MTDDSRSKLQAAATATLMEQGYGQAHAAEVARRWYPTPAQDRMAKARAAKAVRNGAASATTESGGMAQTVVISQAVPARGGYHTPEGRKHIGAAASSGNKARWARVRELGLRNLKELAQYDLTMKNREERLSSVPGVLV